MTGPGQGRRLASHAAVVGEVAVQDHADAEASSVERAGSLMLMAGDLRSRHESLPAQTGQASVASNGMRMTTGDASHRPDRPRRWFVPPGARQ